VCGKSANEGFAGAAHADDQNRAFGVG
jgi:hypothetical protein